MKQIIRLVFILAVFMSNIVHAYINNLRDLASCRMVSSKLALSFRPAICSDNFKVQNRKEMKRIPVVKAVDSQQISRYEECGHILRDIFSRLAGLSFVRILQLIVIMTSFESIRSVTGSDSEKISAQKFKLALMRLDSSLLLPEELDGDVGEALICRQRVIS